MGVVVCPVRNGAHGGKGYSVVQAHLGHRGALHFHGQHIVACSQQRLAQRARDLGTGDEAVATGHQALVQTGRTARWARVQKCPFGGQAVAHCLRQLRREFRIAGQAHTGVARHQPALEQGRHIHVVLHIVVRHHHIAHLHAIAHPACHAREHDALGCKTLNQHRGGGGRSHLANARERQHHRLAMQRPRPEGAPCVHHAPGLLQAFHQTGLFFGKGTEDGCSHGKDKKKSGLGGRSALWRKECATASASAYFLSRSSRRRILPTGVLGSSVRNSITLGCL